MHLYLITDLNKVIAIIFVFENFIVFVIVFKYYAMYLDPSLDQTLFLVCRGIRWHQKVTERRRLPVTIDILKSLKSYMCPSNHTLCKQRMLRSLFTLSFYGFLHASECLSLTWSDIKRIGNHLVIELHQSKTDPF